MILLLGCFGSISDEASHQGGDLVCRRVEREMTSIEDMHKSIPHVPPVRLRLRPVERQIVLAPDHKESWLRLAHPRLPLGIGLDICAVVVEEIALNVGLARLIEKGELVRPEIRVVPAYVRIVADMSSPRGRERKKIRPQRAFVRRAVGPKRAPRLPVRTEPFVGPPSVLDEERLDSVRMR